MLRKSKDTQELDKIVEELELSQEDYVKLSSYINHEQRNMMAILRGKIQLSGNDELLQEVDNIVEAMDDILTMAASNGMYKNHMIDVHLLCAKAVDECIQEYQNISFVFHDDSDALMVGREIWVYRAIINLIENAIKYGDDSHIIVSVTVKKGSIIIAVQDTGTGINLTQQHQIFENYYRINDLKKDGYGIGLNLVKHVCNLCNGCFYVESEMQIGSTFYMVFPQLILSDID